MTMSTDTAATVPLTPPRHPAARALDRIAAGRRADAAWLETHPQRDSAIRREQALTEARLAEQWADMLDAQAQVGWPA